METGNSNENMNSPFCGVLCILPYRWMVLSTDRRTPQAEEFFITPQLPTIDGSDGAGYIAREQVSPARDTEPTVTLQRPTGETRTGASLLNDKAENRLRRDDPNQISDRVEVAANLTLTR